MTKNNISNLSNISIETDVREYLAASFRLFNIAENYKMVYRKDPSSSIPRILISYYYKQVKPNYNEMLYTFKRKYVANEALVEKNDTKEQRQGINLVYDYIQNYQPNGENFSIFINALQINSYLWKFVDEKFMDDLSSRREEIERLKREAKEERDPAKFRKAMEQERDLSKISSKNKLGGRFRTDDEEAHLLGLDINVPSASEAKNFMNSFLSKEKIEEFKYYYNSPDIFEYIDYCVRITAQMIKAQPFPEGNKRTFRSLLNLLFKNRNLPPVYIKADERDEYKRALYVAMKDGNYKDLCGFYYFKICDSIYELDIAPYLSNKNENNKNNNNGIQDDQDSSIRI